MQRLLLTRASVNGLIENIQNLDNVASSLSSAVSEVKSIQAPVIEMREQRQKFNEAVSELIEDKTEEEADRKDKSQSPTIPRSSLSPHHYMVLYRTAITLFCTND